MVEAFEHIICLVQSTYYISKIIQKTCSSM